jgi:phosphoadenosine phosphosulfate reductase
MTQSHLQGARIDDGTPAADVVAWSLERFRHRRLVITTSFGMEGCALIDLFAGHGVPLPVVYLDTMFFFPETYALRDRLAARYPHLRFINAGTDLTPEAQAAIHGPELWRTDPDRCCRLRKVEPMRRVLEQADVWVTAITREQGGDRADTRVMEWDWQFQVLKLAPLAGWSRRQVREYVSRHDVPYNELHDRGYPSVGCMQCTRPVVGLAPGDYSRAGRWSGTTKIECGLHVARSA